MITFSYQSSSTAIVDPRVIRVREDLDWKEVMRTHIQDLSLNGMKSFFFLRWFLCCPVESSNAVIKLSPTTTEYWTSKRGRSARVMLEEIAKSRNLDPHYAETWYSIPQSLVMGLQVIIFVKAYYNCVLGDASDHKLFSWVD